MISEALLLQTELVPVTRTELFVEVTPLPIQPLALATIPPLVITIATPAFELPAVRSLKLLIDPETTVMPPSRTVVPL